MICKTLASIELSIRRDPSARFISWRDILDRAPEDARRAAHPLRLPARTAYTFPDGPRQAAQFDLIPDATFGIEYTVPGDTKAYRFFNDKRHRLQSDGLGILDGQVGWQESPWELYPLEEHTSYHTLGPELAVGEFKGSQLRNAPGHGNDDLFGRRVRAERWWGASLTRPASLRD